MLAVSIVFTDETSCVPEKGPKNGSSDPPRVTAFASPRPARTSPRNKRIYRFDDAALVPSFRIMFVSM